MSDTAAVTTWLITGSSRGIGLEFVRQLIAFPSNFVIATCRNPDSATALNALTTDAKGTLQVAKLDISDEADIRASAKTIGEILGDRGLDYLLNNAAVTEGSDTPFGFSVPGFLRTMQANVAGPAVIAQSYLPFIEKSDRKVVMNMTSGLASIGLDLGPNFATYSISKTALNMLTYKQAREKPKIIFVVVDPGWVKTDMGGEGATFKPHESVSALIKLLTSRKLEHSGKFFKYDGTELPW